MFHQKHMNSYMFHTYANLPECINPIIYKANTSQLPIHIFSRESLKLENHSSLTANPEIARLQLTTYNPQIPQRT